VDPKIFPFCDQPGDDFSDIDRVHLRKIATQSISLTQREFIRVLAEHARFLQTGGGGGHWETINVNGVIVGAYSGLNQTEGAQAVLNNRNLLKLELQGILLSYANLVGIFAERQNFSSANLSHCLITDAMLAEANFTSANLLGVDFSRSDLRGCNFSGANVKYADFENCDLTGATFMGARLDHSRFPGAILENVRI